ncbi:MAG: 16S rRNA (guanine(966)-N(2))-methyltransferase RsmD [Anaerolineae bacterium]
MRVIAGEAKGRRLHSVPGSATRPILDRVKESLFNILSWEVVDARFLDLFAGTGSVGIEALSRGAAHADFVEKAGKAIATIKRNLKDTKLADRATVIRRDVFGFIADADDQYHLIFLAPPQYQGLWADALRALDRRPALLAAHGKVIAQIDPQEFEDLALQNLTLIDQRTYGNTRLCFYSHRTHEVVDTTAH